MTMFNRKLYLKSIEATNNADAVAQSSIEGRAHQWNNYRRLIRNGYRSIHREVMETKYNPLKDGKNE